MTTQTTKNWLTDLRYRLQLYRVNDVFRMNAGDVHRLLDTIEHLEERIAIEHERRLAVEEDRAAGRRITLDLLELAEEQHHLVTELLELLALGHKMTLETATEARQRQARIARKLARVRRNLTGKKAKSSSAASASDIEKRRGESR